MQFQVIKLNINLSFESVIHILVAGGVALGIGLSAALAVLYEALKEEEQVVCFLRTFFNTDFVA